jgi:hypothetical protein
MGTMVSDLLLRVASATESAIEADDVFRALT